MSSVVEWHGRGPRYETREEGGRGRQNGVQGMQGSALLGQADSNLLVIHTMMKGAMQMQCVLEGWRERGSPAYEPLWQDVTRRDSCAGLHQGWPVGRLEKRSVRG